jgi:hypothetical protein
LEAEDLFLETVDPSGLLLEAAPEHVEHDSREADREKKCHRGLI